MLKTKNKPAVRSRSGLASIDSLYDLGYEFNENGKISEATNPLGDKEVVITPDPKSIDDLPKRNVKIYREGKQDNGEINLPGVTITAEQPKSYMGIPSHVYSSPLYQRMSEDRDKAGRDIALGMATIATPELGLVVSGLGKLMTPSTYTNWVLPYFGASLGTAATVGTLADAGWTGYWGYNSGKNVLNAIRHPENLTTFWDYALLPFDVFATGAGAAGVKRAINAGSQALRLSFYNHLTPFGYNSPVASGYGRQIPAKEEIKRAIKGFFIEDVPIDPEYIPEWQHRINISDYVWDINNLAGANLTDDAVINFRKLAFRKGLRLPETKVNNIYNSNGDGTFKYDYDAITRINNRRPNKYKAFLETDGRALDISTTNGALIALKKLPNGKYKMYDKWDLLPWKDKNRSLNKFISKIPWVRNIEALYLLGGKPFVLEQTIEPEEIYTFMNLK